MTGIGPGVREIRVRDAAGAFRIIYIRELCRDRLRITCLSEEDTADIKARHRARSGSVQAIEARSFPMKRHRFASIWDAIEPSRSASANMKARAEMMNAIRESVAAWDMTQAAAAKRLGLTQPRMNDLLRGRINKFSLYALKNLATRAGLSVRVQITKTAA
jgi:predicted XRE-type DNA-binding protein